MKEDIFIAAGLDLDTTFFFFLILYPLRHCGAAWQAEILGAASGAEMDDSQQMKKIVPLTTCEIPFSQHVCELVFGVNVTDLNFSGSELILSNNQSRATLWVLETCLIVGLLPFVIILITASLSSKTYNKGSWWEDWTFEGIKSTLSKSLITLRDCLRLWIVCGGEKASRLFNNRSTKFYTVLIRVSKNWNDQIHRSRAGIPSNLNPASKEMISDCVELCETEVCFPNIQMIGTNVWLPKTHNVPPDVDFESSRSPAKSGVLKQSQPALFCSMTHITILCIFTWNRWYWTNTTDDPFVTCEISLGQ